MHSQSEWLADQWLCGQFSWQSQWQNDSSAWVLIITSTLSFSIISSFPFITETIICRKSYLTMFVFSFSLPSSIPLCPLSPGSAAAAGPLLPSSLPLLRWSGGLRGPGPHVPASPAPNASREPLLPARQQQARLSGSLCLRQPLLSGGLQPFVYCVGWSLLCLVAECVAELLFTMAVWSSLTLHNEFESDIVLSLILNKLHCRQPPLSVCKVGESWHFQGFAVLLTISILCAKPANLVFKIEELKMMDGYRTCQKGWSKHNLISSPLQQLAIITSDSEHIAAEKNCLFPLWQGQTFTH